MVKWFENIGPGKPPVPAPAAAAEAEIPEGVKQFGNSIKAVMPMIEDITGLKRDQIFLQLMKTTLKGGNLESLINGFLGLGKPPAQEVKFVRVVKTLAIWVPIGFGLTCAVLIGLYFVIWVMTRLMGALPV